MKKTLIITLEFPPQIGGIASYTYQFAKSLNPERVIVLAPPNDNAAEWDSQQPFKILREPFYYNVFWPKWWRLRKTVKKIVEQESIEMIHVHHVLPVGYAAYAVRKLVPYLIFSHGTDIIIGTKKKRKKRFMKRLLDSATQVILNSDAQRRRLLELFPDLENKSTIVYPCPEKAFFHRPPDHVVESLRSQLALEGKKVVLSVGRIAEGKGFPHLARDMKTILERHRNVVWLIIGDGPKKSILLEQIQKQGLQNVVRFLGDVPHDALPNYYALADVFALLTHPDNGFEEGLGMVFLEAAAAGVPIVAGRSGGVEEAVIHGKTGLLVDTYQDEQVVGAIDRLLSEPALAQELSEAGKRRMQTEFSWKHQLEKLAPYMGTIAFSETTKDLSHLAVDFTKTT